MLFQTLVQLNILILATPALAGWSLLPLTQPGVVRAACVGFQGRTAEAVALKTAASETTPTLSAARSQPAALPRFALVAAQGPAVPVLALFDAASAAVASCNPFPHAARAP